MRIDVKGRNLPVSEELREHVAKRFRKIERQVSELAELEVEVREERNPAIADSEIAEATLHLKGATLRASAASPDIVHSINLVSDELARQVKRNREKRRGRREARAAAAQQPNPESPGLNGELVLEGDTVLEAEVIPTPEDLPPEASSAA
jgi:putative sigma-54 modulation protein